MNTLANSHYLGLGKVFHRRRVPKPHSFAMSVYMLWVNLNHSDSDQAILKLGKLSHFAPTDYWEKTAKTTKELQSQLITEWQSRGLTVDNICVLTNPRSLNTAMNPLSVFYCYRNTKLVALIAEVTNTPWGERHHYFITIALQNKVKSTAVAHWKDNQLICHFNKDFHVSPFNPMGMKYEMRFTQTTEKITVTMYLTQKELPIFDAKLKLKLQPLTSTVWYRSFFRQPWLTMQIRTRIYFEALRLFLKGIPFFKHPKHHE